MDKMENTLWWFVFNEVGVHPDDYHSRLDLSSPESLEVSLKKEGFGDFKVPTEPVIHGTFKEFCREVAKYSPIVDKTFVYWVAYKCDEVKRLWEECNPADAPEVEDAAFMACMNPNPIF